jgi:hypothetical protein
VLPMIVFREPHNARPAQEGDLSPAQ